MKLKAKVVEGDEFETTGLRAILNFGHTIGHAIESISHEKGAPLLHGEAIALGLVAEAFISHRQGLIAMNDVQRVRAACQKAGLPVTMDGSFSDQAIISKIGNDKKNVGGEVRWVLLAKIGKAIFDQKSDQVVLKESLEFIRNG